MPNLCKIYKKSTIQNFFTQKYKKKENPITELSFNPPLYLFKYPI